MKSTINNGFYPRVSRAFALLPALILIGFLRNIIKMMTGNSAYQTPPPNPALADVATAVDDLERKNQASMNRGRVEIAARRASQAVALNLARQLGNYVETQANGSLETLLSSGFDAVRAPSPSVVPAAPTNMSLSYTSNTGELLLRFTGDYNVNNYSVQYAEDPSGPWTDNGLSTATRVLITGLTPGTVYWVQACANGSAGTSDWSMPATIIAV